MTFTALLHTATNPGIQPTVSPDDPILITVAIVATAVALIGGLAYIADTRAHDRDWLGLPSSIFIAAVIAMMIGCLAATVTAPIVGSTRAGEWRQDTTRYLKAEYGITANDNIVRDLARGKTIVVTYNGVPTAIKAVNGDHGLNILTTGDRPLKPVHR